MIGLTRAHPREVFRTAVQHGATGIACVHNHPSGESATRSMFGCRVRIVSCKPHHGLCDEKLCWCLFVPSPHLRVGYATGQLLHYQLTTRQPDLADDPTQQPQLLTLGFATADVVISGRRLELVCAKIAPGQLIRLRVIPERYAALTFATRPFVGRIEIQPIRNQDATDLGRTK